MCLFAARGVNARCQHTECQVIRTIQKLNKPIFKPKKITQLYVQREIIESEDEDDEDDAISIQIQETRKYSK